MIDDCNIELLIEQLRLAFIFSSVEPIPEEILLSWLKERSFEESLELPRKVTVTG